jgi:hypothetical protein
MKLEESFEQALRSPDPFVQLRSLAVQLFAEGQSQEAVVARFESARQQLREAGREAKEDTLMDVMDCLVGWCGPHARLGPAPQETNGSAPGCKQEDPLHNRGG